KKIQEIDLEFFSQLGSGDVLFIDSSHTVKIGSDVNYLFLEVLPRLRPGVIVHVHDIFMPFEYRRDWVLDEFRFWTEQYILQAFLTFNSEFDVLLANSYLNHYHQQELKAAFPSLSSWASGSFWMRRKPKPNFEYYKTRMVVWLSTNPEMHEEINKPICLVGSTRSGTSILTSCSVSIRICFQCQSQIGWGTSLSTSMLPARSPRHATIT